MSAGTPLSDSSAPSDGGRITSSETQVVGFDPPKSFAVDEGRALGLPWTPNTAVVARDRQAFFVYPDEVVAVTLPEGETQWRSEAAIDGRRVLVRRNDWSISAALSGDGKHLYSAVPTIKPGVGTVRDSLQVLFSSHDTSSGEREWKQFWTVPIPKAAAGGPVEAGSWKTKALGEVDGNIVFGFWAYLLDFRYLTIAVGKTDGQVKWVQEGEPYLASRNLVIATQYDYVAYSVAALEAKTGKVVWSSEKTYGYYSPQSVWRDKVDVDSLENWVQYSLSTGKMLSKEKKGLNGLNLNCRTDGKADLVVCSSTRSTWAFNDKVVWHLPSGDRGNAYVTAVYAGQVYAQGPSGAVVLDARTGADITADAGIAPTAVTPFAGILYDRENSTWTVYRTVS